VLIGALAISIFGSGTWAVAMVCPVMAVVALLVARMSTDEIARQLDSQGPLATGVEATT
jgi:hypothetical protein